IGTPAELRDRRGVTPENTARLEITVPGGSGLEVAELMESLRHRPGGLQVTIFGHTIHALVSADSTPQSLGLDPSQGREADGGLEDVFVTAAREAGGEPGCPSDKSGAPPASPPARDAPSRWPARSCCTSCATGRRS